MFFAEWRKRRAAAQWGRDYVARETMVAVQDIAAALAKPPVSRPAEYRFNHDQWKFDMLIELGYSSPEDLERLSREPLAILEETDEVIVNEVVLDGAGIPVVNPDGQTFAMRQRILPIPAGFAVRDVTLPDGVVRRFPVKVG